MKNIFLSDCKAGAESTSCAQRTAFPEAPAKMADFIFSNINFCLARNFPDKAFLKEYFSGELAARGIYIDATVALKNREAAERIDAVLLGSCVGELCLDRYALSRVYVKHSGRLKIDAGGCAMVCVELFDDAQAEVFAGADAEVCVYVHDRATVRAGGSGEVKVVYDEEMRRVAVSPV
ncbi:MAG: hypothetical protein PUB21_00710 [Bacteroidales bacterium]|nr:hypothetical protein [Bacteroidales bacterium]